LKWIFSGESTKRSAKVHADSRTIFDCSGALKIQVPGSHVVVVVEGQGGILP